MVFLLLPIIIAFLAIIVPGVLLALPLLKKTGLGLFEVLGIGFIFGFMWPPILTWLEGYLMNYIHFFTFSTSLYLVNVAILTVIGLILCMWQGVFTDFKNDFLKPMEGHKHAKAWVWVLLFIIILSVFFTRLQSLPIAPNFFEFDPYFDMIDTNYILTYGQQLLLDPSAWPAIPGGTNHRIEPIVPYIEAFWYNTANDFGGLNYGTLNTSLMSDVSGVYPPIAAGLLVFVIFMIIYHEYDEKLGLLAGGLAATMPVLFTTFIAGEQLVEPWGIFALFFFIAAYMLAVKNMKSKRLAILAGIAFVANFLGAHYYTVTIGVYVIYMLLQGTIDIVRGESSIDFYKMNGIVLAIIGIFTAFYMPYGSTLQNRIPDVLGMPIIFTGPLLALILVAVMDYGPKLLKKYNIVFKSIDLKERIAWIIAIAVIALLVIAFTPIGKPVYSYVNLSKKFTSPSSALFMTVQEYIPTGLLYNFGGSGFGFIGNSYFGIPILVWVISAAALVLIVLSIIYRKSKTAVLYAAIALPLMVAGFSEVKYLPHFGAAYILLFCIMLGELIYLAEHNFKLRENKVEIKAEAQESAITHDSGPQHHKNMYLMTVIYAIGLFFLSTILAFAYLAYTALKKQYPEQNTYIWAVLAILVFITLLSTVFSGSVLYGESNSYLSAISAAAIYSSASSPAQACSQLQNNDIGYTLYCNTIQPYWLNAMAWLRQNVGPNAPRVLAWWDYGDWINWFGNSNAFLRGDNANAIEDYATAAHYVLGDRFPPSALANFMNTNQSKYVLFDQDLIGKWGALDFLGCVYTNETSYNFAVAQGQSQNPPVPFALGNSQCELQHDPEYALIPLQALIPTNSSPNINIYCSISTASAQYAQAYLVQGQGIANQTVCVSLTPNPNGVMKVYNSTGSQLNAYINDNQYIGVVNVQGVPFVQYMMIYVPNSANGTITDAPSKFYSSNYYKGFILGNLPGFTEAYPANATGMINYVNGTYPVRIYELNNFTGQLPPVPPKPPWVHNNYTIP